MTPMLYMMREVMKKGYNDKIRLAFRAPVAKDINTEIINHTHTGHTLNIQCALIF